jgi:arginine exporter protein ArgO
MTGGYDGGDEMTTIGDVDNRSRDETKWLFTIDACQIAREWIALAGTYVAYMSRDVFDPLARQRTNDGQRSCELVRIR